MPCHDLARSTEYSARERPYGLALALCLAALAALPLLIGPGIVLTRAGGDSPFLIQRVHQLAQNLRAGIAPAQWMPDAAYGLGYPMFRYYAALPYYLAAALDIAGAGVLWGTKLTQALGFLLAGWAMYRLARASGANAPGAVLASAAYTYAPFHLANVYVRGDALSEFYAYALYPLIIWALIALCEKATPARIAALAASYAALALTHNISVLIFSPLVGVWLLVEALGSRPRRAWRTLLWGGLALALGLALSAWFWWPALSEQNLVQLQEQTTGYFHYEGHFRTLNLVNWRPVHNYSIDGRRDPFNMGLIQVLLTLASLAALVVRRIKRQPISRVQGLAILALVVYTVLMTPLSNWLWAHMPLLPFVQFPWRLLAVQAVAVSLLTIVLTEALNNWRAWTVSFIAASALAIGGMVGLNLDRLSISESEITPERLMLFESYSGNIGTTIRYEYLPREMLPRPYTSAVQANGGRKPAPLALEGKLTAANLVARNPESESWQIEVAEESLLAFHTVAFPNWQASVDGIAQPLESLGGLGLIGLRLPAGQHRVELRYRSTSTRQAMGRVSLGAGMVWLALALYPAFKSARYRLGALAVVWALIIAGAWVVVTPISLPATGAFTGPLVMDTTRAPYLHHEPEGVYWGDVHLTDYAIEETELEPGGHLRVTLSWDASHPDYQAHVQLLGLTAHHMEPAPIWAKKKGAITTTQTTLEVTLPDDLPPGLYAPRLVIEKDGDEQLASTASGRSMDRLSLAPVQVVAARRATGQEQALAAYGPEQAPPEISLLALSADRTGKRTVAVSLTWRSERQAPLNYMMSLRLEHPDGYVVVSRDLPPLLGGYPTSLWRPGELVADRVILILPQDETLRADYTLRVVLYDRATMRSIGEGMAQGVDLR